ncbi:hypothetical protein SFC65_19565 [Priestia filamentosa]|uniref:hypothetical protein n=1 Tax=Priestia filamentosa TaxID=1402861 RepID=UPI003981A6D0
MSHLTVAVSKNVFRDAFFTFRDNFRYEIPATSITINGLVGSATVHLSGEAKLENGNFELLDDRIRVSELDVTFNRLNLRIDLDLNRICVGGGCAIRNPINGECAVRNPIPETCIFEDNPDTSIGLDLTPYVRTELSLDGLFQQEYVQGEQGNPSQWKVTILPDIPDVDVLDVADVVGEMLENQLKEAIENLIPGDGPVEDLILQAIGGLTSFIRRALDAGDDLGEWVRQLILTRFQLIRHLLEFLERAFKENFHTKFLTFNDPYEMVKKEEVEWEDGSRVELPPVLIGIKDFNFEVNSDEMKITANLSS